MSYTAVQRAAKYKQPRGGLLPVKKMKRMERGEDGLPFDMGMESVSPTTTGTAVDYLTRALLFDDPYRAFSPAVWGAQWLGREREALAAIERIVGLDDASVRYAVELACYEEIYYGGPWSATYKPGLRHCNEASTANIVAMVERSLSFFSDVGPVVLDGCQFQGALTDTVAAAECDYVTESTLWDMKVSKKPPTSKHTLQLLIYWRMGLRCDDAPLFSSVKKLGIWNPRLNASWTFDVSGVSEDTVREVDGQVIGYA